MAYYALKSVHFDKDYSIGDLIPDEAIDPAMEKRLIGWGKISKIEGDVQQIAPPPPPELSLLGLPVTEDVITDFEARVGVQPEEGDTIKTRSDRVLDALLHITAQTTADDAHNTPEDDVQGDGTQQGGNNTSEVENAQDDVQGDGGGAEFKCPVCGKVCKTKSALMEHQKTHGR